MPDGRVIVALGDVAGKGSPAALLMALLLAVLRTLVDERLDPAPLVERLNAQICRHSPASRFITLFYAVYDPATGALTYVNAGQNPPLIRRHDGALRAADRDRRGTGDVRGIAVRRGPDDRCAGRSARSLQRRHHRSRGPDRPAVRGSRARQVHRRRTRPRHRRSWPPTCWPRSNGTPIGSRFVDDLTILLLKRAAAV